MSKGGLNGWGLLRFALVVLLCWFVGRGAVRGLMDLQAQGIAWHDVRFRWVIVSALAYLGGLLPMGHFWYQVLHAMGEHPPRLATLRAYFIGHLGKYVPGKAAVVLLRMAVLRTVGADPVRVAVSIFVETLTMMAVGACCAALFLVGETLTGNGTYHPALLAIAVGLLFVAGLPTLPRVMRYLVAMVQKRRGGAPAEVAWIAGVDGRVIMSGWLANVPGWILLGVSYWAAVRALPLPDTAVNVSYLPRCVASVGLSVVAGFLSLLPGGLGVRELVLRELMVGVVGPSAAIVSAVWLRLIWLFTEVVAAAIMVVWQLLVSPRQSTDGKASNRRSSDEPDLRRPFGAVDASPVARDDER